MIVANKETTSLEHRWRDRRCHQATKTKWVLVLLLVAFAAFGRHSKCLFKCALTLDGETTQLQEGRSTPNKLHLQGIVARKKVDTSERYLSVVLRTWHEDAALAFVALESVVNVIDKNLLEIVVVTDQESENIVRSALFDPIIAKFPEIHDQGRLSLHVEPMLFLNGHIQQKFSKMVADTYTKGEYILHIDSDCVITQWQDSCFLEYDKPINDYATFESLPKNVHVWKRGTEVFLGIEEEIFEFSRLNQHVYPRELYSVLRNHAEEVHGVSFLESFTKLGLVGRDEDLHEMGPSSSLLISDFNLLGATAFHFAPDLMTPRDLTNHKSPWRPFCIAQCEARLMGSSCCRQWMETQIRLANEGKPTKVHADCKIDFAPNDPCYCADKG
ncbi:hypothetical protein IV203_018747 [Nitzschia inconspicua]|uniref:Uncharacterized protein n=1 Tax=Nitzschia inconspicua TaxID=303405 RepID=A0A9K3M1Y0_9STRA|nr:hypothetical protein IV203_018747 [Nitzschia inconspicua]